VAKIVQAMKDFSHPGTETKVPVDLNRAIESTLTVCRNEWKYVADLQTDFDPSLPVGLCLPGEFNQVILNIVVNAAHAIADKEGKGQGKGRHRCQHAPPRRRGGNPHQRHRHGHSRGGARADF
jgi:nitrogen-specific signal transduction histidine kinase